MIGLAVGALVALLVSDGVRKPHAFNALAVVVIDLVSLGALGYLAERLCHWAGLFS